MNNYCTNCGKKLNRDELICPECNTPIIDLPDNYIYKSPRRRKLFKILIKSILILILLIISLVLIIRIAYKHKIEFLKTKYVEEYIEKNYPDQEFSIEYDRSGKCIISGECYVNRGSGCDQMECEEYEYLDRFKCRSYFYNVTINKKEHEINVFRKDGKYSVIEGRNIYGIKEEDEYKDNEIENDIDNNYTTNNKSSDNNIVDIIDEYPFESNYYNFNDGTTNNKLVLNDNNTMSFFTGALESNSNIYISGHISNPNYNNGTLLMRTKFYDKEYNEMGVCNDEIQLLGKGYSDIDFSCHILKTDLKDNKEVADIKYYKVIIDEYVGKEIKKHE